MTLKVPSNKNDKFTSDCEITPNLPKRRAQAKVSRIPARFGILNQRHERSRMKGRV